jgi:tetratricopeptide (TPR) repeat protein
MAKDENRYSQHASGMRSQVRFVLWLLGPPTVISIVLMPFLGTLAMLMFLGCLAGWAVFGVYTLVYQGMAGPTADAIGRVLVPSGSSTPSVNQHSDIETLWVRGKYAEAAAAYQAAIAADPNDLVACEKLGQLAMQELNNYQLAVTAYREAERRAASEKSKIAFGIIVAELYRDKLGEPKRAVVELGRLLARYPDAPNAAALRDELELIKAHLFEGGRP